jgi:uncharacterized protein YjiS (DUF1127 family)
MTQTKTRRRQSVPLTYRIDPIGALAGYATVFAEIHDTRPTPSRPRDASRAAFVPSCPFQWSAPTSKAIAPTVELADATPDGDFAPRSQGRPRSWLARLWSRYVAWRERQRAAAAWEMLDARTLRDIGVLQDEVDHDAQSASWWRRYDTVL